MKVSINQPAYLPWLGYYERIVSSDIHIVLDHVQYEKNSFVNRNKVRVSKGWCWLTVPLKTKGKFGDLAINKIEIDNSTYWSEKHWKTIQMNYAKAPFFAEHKPFFDDIYSQEWGSLSELLKEMNSYLLSVLQIKTTLLFSSEMKISGVKDELILNLCKEVGADYYLSGALGKNYLREAIFEEKGIKVEYQDYKHPEYNQVYSGFEPYMAVVDLLFNYGLGSLDILARSDTGLAFDCDHIKPE